MNQDQLIKVASVVVGVLASATFVAAAGGAVLWARFYGAELPVEQAVAKVPNAELVVIGAAAVVGFLLAGLISVVGVYALDDKGTPGALTRRGLVALVVAEVLVALVLIEDHLWRALLIGLGLVVAGMLLVYLLDDLARGLTAARANGPEQDPRWLNRLNMWVLREVFGGVSFGGAVRRVIVAFLLVIGVLVVALVEQPIIVILWGLITILFIGPIAIWYRSSSGRRRVLATAVLTYGLIVLIRFDEALALPVIAALVLATLNLGVAKATGNRFAFYGVSVFLSVVMFGGVLSYARTKDYPKLQSVAVVLKDGTASCGLYVAETDSRLYMARLDVVGGRRKVDVVDGSGRMSWVPRDQIERSELGPLQGVISALANAADLRDELVSEEGKEPKTRAGAVPPAGGCNAKPDTSPPIRTTHWDLARKFQPRIVVDRRDGFWPMSTLTAFRLKRGDSRTCRQLPGECIHTTRPNELPWAGGVNQWLDFPAGNTSTSQQHRSMAAALGEDDPATTARQYFLRTGGRDGELTSLQYWMFYAFNYQPLRVAGGRVARAGFHEGDFELVGILLSRESKRPRYVWMARHGNEGRPFAWSQPVLERERRHLTVYAARGSHATYESCGMQRRPGVPPNIDDEAPCGSEKLPLEPLVTPLRDLAFAPWVCWEGRFGYSKPSNKTLNGELYLAKGPLSPLWQQKFGRSARPCASVQSVPSRANVTGEEVLDDVTATTLRDRGGKLDGVFDNCADWQKPPTRGVYVVACSVKVLKAYFNSGLEDIGSEMIRIGRSGRGASPLSVPAIYSSSGKEDPTGILIGAAKATTATVYVACFSGNRRVSAVFPNVRLSPNQPLELNTNSQKWALNRGGTAVLSVSPDTEATTSRCDRK